MAEGLPLELEQTAATASQLLADGRTSGLVVVASAGDAPAATVAVGHPPDALFRWTSGSKSAVGVAALVAVTEGRFSLSDPVVAFLPELARFPDITIAHLLNHSSGLTELIPRTTGEPRFDDVLTLMATNPAAQPLPTGEALYTGSVNYWLIAGLLERVYQRPFPDLCADLVFAPCGMTSTTFGLRPDDPNAPRLVPLEALPGQGDGLRPGYHPIDWQCPASSLIGPVGDAHRLLRAVDLARRGEGPLAVDGALAATATRGTRPSTYDHAIRRTADFGYGFMIDMADRACGSWNPESYGHVGGLGGSTVFALIADPSRDVVVAIGMGGMAVAPAGFVRWIRLGNALIADLDVAWLLS